MSEQATGNDRFARAATNWDASERRRRLAADVSQGIRALMEPSGVRRALEYGCGTGLVSAQLAGDVRELVAMDASAAMLDVLRAKRDAGDLPAHVLPLLGDLLAQPAARYPGLDPESFGLIFSSMTLHHVPQVQELLQRLVALLEPGGWLALADLEAEDGSFHEDGSGVAHDGFDPQWLANLVQSLGVVDVQWKRVSEVRKQREDSEVVFGVFLLWGRRG